MMYSTPERYIKSVQLLNEKYVANEEAEKAAAVEAAAAAAAAAEEEAAAAAMQLNATHTANSTAPLVQKKVDSSISIASDSSKSKVNPPAKKTT